MEQEYHLTDGELNYFFSSQEKLDNWFNDTSIKEKIPENSLLGKETHIYKPIIDFFKNYKNKTLRITNSKGIACFLSVAFDSDLSPNTNFTFEFLYELSQKLNNISIQLADGNIVLTKEDNGKIIIFDASFDKDGNLKEAMAQITEGI
ncbi:MAG: hypothetical protein AABY32_02165 [Nanoarchaeota archaeon]